MMKPYPLRLRNFPGSPTLGDLSPVTTYYLYHIISSETIWVIIFFLGVPPTLRVFYNEYWVFINSDAQWRAGVRYAFLRTGSHKRRI